MKSVEVAVVDAEHVRVELERRAPAPRRRGYLHDRVEVEAPSRARRARASSVRAQRADHEQHGVGAGHLRLVELVRVDREVLAQDRQLGGGARLAQVGQRAAEVGLLGEDRDGGRAAALVGEHDLGDSSRPRGSRPPTASAACARRSATCRGATAPRANGRPSRAGRRPRARARTAGARACAARTPSRVALDQLVQPDAHAPCSPPRSGPARRARRRSRSTPRPAARPRRASRRGRRRRSRRRRSARASERSVPGVAGQDVARSTAALRVGRAGAHGGVVRAARSPKLLGVSPRRRRTRPSAQLDHAGGPGDTRTRRAHRRSTLPGPSPAPRAASAEADRLELAPGSETPITWRVAPAGLVSGPRKLKTVRTASSLRTGTTCLIAWWWSGANMKPKPTSVDALGHALGLEVDPARRAPPARPPSRSGWWPSGCRAWPRGSPRRPRSARRWSRR